jgi:phosphate-selective porin OprO/OprP
MFLTSINGFRFFIVPAEIILLFAFSAVFGQIPDSVPADISALEFRISTLEEMLKKKADKPDPAKGFTVKVDGRIFLDSYHLSGSKQSGTPSFRNDLNFNGFKDLRIGATGEGYRNYAYKVDFYFGNSNTVEVRDVWLSASNVPLFDTVKIGHHRIEEGISALQPGLHTLFIFFEGMDFTNFYRLGISSRHLWMHDRLRFFAGLFEFKPVLQSLRNETAESVNWGTIANVRLTYMPYASKDKDGKIDGKNMMLFGVNYGFYDVNSTEQQFTERYAQFFGALQRVNISSVSNYQQTGLEFAAQQGPLAVQSEVYVRTYNRKNSKDAAVWGTYLEGRVFLTGDFRRFNASQAVWNGAALKHNLEFVTEHGWNLAEYIGAWELAGRWGYTDLSAFDKAGIEMPARRVNDFTAGLNWYWSERTRVMFNYTRIIPADKTGGHSGMDLFAVSFRYYF